MKKTRLLMLAGALAVVPSLFAVSGKTMINYIAYDAAFWPKNMPVTPDNYCRIELNGFLGSSFDTLVFSPMFAFGSMAAVLKSADYPKHNMNAEVKWLGNTKNGMPELVKAGGDPIALTVKWCRDHKKEAVVSLPINLCNAHQYIPTKERPSGSWYAYLFPTFKAQNPDVLMNGDGKGSCPYSSSYCVDYSSQKVRDKFAAIACEIAGKYDIDGIMVDFMMSPTIFKSVATGGTASAKETEQLTAMMNKIKAACAAASGRLGHKVAFSARVPDSMGYCKDIGINLQAWFDAKMLDYVVYAGMFQLSPLKDSAEFAKKAGIPYYLSHTVSGIYVYNDSGYSSDDERIPRQSAATYAARNREAMLNGFSGCMYSMYQHHEHHIPVYARTPYDEKANKFADKRYFVSYTNDRIAGQFLKEWSKHLSCDSLLSNYPVDLAKGIAKRQINVWENFDELKKAGKAPEVTLIVEAVIPSGMDTIVSFNGKELKSFKRRAGTQLYKMPAGLCKFGANEVVLKSKGKNKRGGTIKLGNIAVEVTFPKEGK